MLPAPYSIYVNKRPLRVAFLIEDEPASLPIVDSILKYNRDLWGGRYNPIVISDGQTLTDAWWSLLDAVDPDLVTSFVTLSDDLITCIERRISPHLILQQNRRTLEDGQSRIDLPNHGLSVLPTPSNIQMVSYAGSESSLVLFKTTSENADPVIKRFIEWNFGGYSHPIETVRRALESTRSTRYSVLGATSLVAPLTELSSFRSFTYPIQLCSLPKEAFPPVEYDRFAEAFLVVIGDTLTDVAYFWNRPATIPEMSRTRLNQVWLPLAVATNAQLTSALSSWLQRSTDPSGSCQSQIRFVSLSLSQKKLEQVVEPLTCDLRGVLRSVNALSEIQPPKVSRSCYGPPDQDKMDHYRATSTTERLTLQEPNICQGSTLGLHWMADLYIEFRPERYPTIIGRPLWWQLPRLNDLASQMFRCSSRILRTRYPSVLMKQGEPRLDIVLLDDLSVFTMLATRPNQSYFSTLDARHAEKLSCQIPYSQARCSEKGRYLSGLLDLFGGLFPATSTLEMRYWRDMFDLLSGRTAHTDATRLVEVSNALRKRLRANRTQFYEDDEAMTWLARYVLKVARSLPAPSRDLEFRIFQERAKKEMEDFNARRPGQEPWEYSQVDLLGALADLTGC